MTFKQESTAQKVHQHRLQRALFISLLAIQPMVEEEGVHIHSSYAVRSGAFDQFYHYDAVDPTKRQKIERINKKYALNTL